MVENSLLRNKDGMRLVESICMVYAAKYDRSFVAFDFSVIPRSVYALWKISSNYKLLKMHLNRIG